MLVAASVAEASPLATSLAEVVAVFIVVVLPQNKSYARRVMLEHSRDLLLASCHANITSGTSKRNVQRKFRNVVPKRAPRNVGFAAQRRRNEASKPRKVETAGRGPKHKDPET